MLVGLLCNVFSSILVSENETQVPGLTEAEGAHPNPASIRTPSGQKLLDATSCLEVGRGHTCSPGKYFKYCRWLG